MKILYLSCHSVLEYDEIRLFYEMGLDVFSHGAYADPENQGDGLRPKIPGLKADPKILEIWRRTSKDHLTEEMVEPFDTILVMATPEWITRNWDVLKKKRVVLRTIGQTSRHREKMLRPYRSKGLQIVRYSPRESRIRDFVGGDAVIRFYKDPEVHSGWSGGQPCVINFTQSMRQRGRECNFAFYKRVMEGLPFCLYGPNNGVIGRDWARGALGFEELCQTLRRSRAYFYVGTYPTNYTLNFVEAWMTGIPVVALGTERGNDPELFGQLLYEIPELIHHGHDGFFSDDEDELRRHLRKLLSDHDYAAAIGRRGRQKAVELFGKDTIRKQWADFLGVSA